LVAPRLRRPFARLGLVLVLAGATLAAARVDTLTPAAAQGEPGISGASGGALQATLSATTENAGSTDPSLPPDLLIQITLDNEAGSDLNGLVLQTPIPNQTQVLDSWDGQEGQQPGYVGAGTISWEVATIPSGSQSGPFAYRIIPDDGVDGATIFVDASIQPVLATPASTPGRPLNLSVQGPLPPSLAELTPLTDATVPVLPLNGLWGEENLRRTVLPTGLTIFTQERPDTPTVALRFAVRAGSRDEDDTTCGGSHWLEHAHFLGTTTRPDNQAIGAAIESVGGEFNASTGWEETSFWDLVPADKFNVAVDVLSDQMLHSTFPPEAFEREKQVIIQEIEGRADDPSTHAFDDFMELVFQTSPLRRSPAATSCLLTLPIATILAYRAQHYVTGDIAIAASGNLTHDAAVAMIRTAFAGLAVGPQFVRPVVPEPIERDPRELVDGNGSSADVIRLGWPVAGVNDADWAATTILADILSDTGRRIDQSLRDNNIFASGVGADYLDFSDAGALMLSATVAPSDRDAAVKLILQQVQQIRDGNVSDADVQAAIRATAGQRALDSELNLSQTDRASDAVAGVLFSYDEALARLDAVTPQDVERVAQTYLDPSADSLVVFQQ
jgi:predicted Zn-dependent peptidase